MSEFGQVTLSEIWRFPIKSVGGEQLLETEIVPTGIPGDREFGLVAIDVDNKIISRKKPGNLALAEASAQIDGPVLNICHPTQGEIEVEIRSGESDLGTLSVLGDRVYGIDQGHEVADYFSGLLGKYVRLVRMDASRPPRKVDTRVESDLNPTTTFTDGYPLTMHSLQSLQAVNRHIEGFPTSNVQFRSNLVIDVDEYSFAEDRMRIIKIGSAILVVDKACSRCVMVEHYRDEEEPDRFSSRNVTLRALKSMDRFAPNRFAATPRPLFGQNLIVEETGQIFAGQDVEVVLSSDSENFIR